MATRTREAPSSSWTSWVARSARPSSQSRVAMPPPHSLRSALALTPGRSADPTGQPYRSIYPPMGTRAGGVHAMQEASAGQPGRRWCLASSECLARCMWQSMGGHLRLSLFNPGAGMARISLLGGQRRLSASLDGGGGCLSTIDRANFSLSGRRTQQNAKPVAREPW